MTMVGIAGIPAGALDAIKDENTRQVLQAIVDGWHVRNGVSGKGDNRFVTVGELSANSGYRLVGGLRSVVQEEAVKRPGITPGEIGRVIADLQASIMESKLWKELGQRVNIIEAGGGVGMTEERTQRLNDDNALMQAVNTLWATVGNNSALVQRGQSGISNQAGAVATAWQQVQSTIKDPVTGQYISSAVVRSEAQTAVNKAGDLEGKYTIKIDVNGHVSGFGLASTANNSTPFSQFIVRADRFSIGSPAIPDYAKYVDNYSDLTNTWIAAGRPDKRDWGYNHYINNGMSEGRIVPNAIQEQIPFIVTTTPSTLNGRTVPPGVYMESAFIRNGSITTADIGVAMVDTLIIQGNAVTQPVFVQQPSNSPITITPYTTVWSGAAPTDSVLTFIDILTLAVPFGETDPNLNAKAMVGFTVAHADDSGGVWVARWRIRRDDGLILGSGDMTSPNNGWGITVSATVFDSAAGKGTRYYTLQIANYGNINVPRKINSSALFALGAKR